MSEIYRDLMVNLGSRNQEFPDRYSLLCVVTVLSCKINIESFWGVFLESEEMSGRGLEIDI